MSYSDGDLEKEVKAVIEATIDLGQKAPASWVVQTVMMRHQNIEGGDKDFYTLCGYGHTRNAVRKVLRLFAADTEQPASPQIVMPGFERLQKAYLVTRDSEQVIVPIDQLTEPEVNGKADEYKRMGEGCYKHADELTRYAAIKFGTASAA